MLATLIACSPNAKNKGKLIQFDFLLAAKRENFMMIDECMAMKKKI